MSSLIINIRFGRWFFQWDRNRPYPGGRRIRFTKDPLRKGQPGEPWFEVYQFPGWR